MNLNKNAKFYFSIRIEHENLYLETLNTFISHIYKISIKY